MYKSLVVKPEEVDLYNFLQIYADKYKKTRKLNLNMKKKKKN